MSETVLRVHIAIYVCMVVTTGHRYEPPPRRVADTSLPRARQELTPSVSDQVSLTLLRPPHWAPLPLSPLGGGLVLFV